MDHEGCVRLAGGSEFSQESRDTGHESLLQPSHIDHEPILHVAARQAVVRFVDLLHANQLDVRGDAVLGAKIQHLLSLAYPANG